MRVQLADTHQSATEAIVVDGQSFALNGRNCSYRFHVDQDSGDLISDHFGGTISEVPTTPETGKYHGLSKQLWYRREYPDLGRGDFRLPAIHIQHAEGHTVSQFQYQGHSLVDGKPRLSGLPSTFGDNGQARTLIIHLYDKYSLVGLDLSYSIFPEHNAIVRSATIINKGGNDIVVDKLASFSTDFPYAEYDVLGLRGEWARECATFRHRVQFGVQGFRSNTGYSSHFHNPFLTLTSPSTTESQGEAWGLSLVYSGSFVAEVEKSPQGMVRTLIGFNQDQLSWPLKPGEHLTSPECVAVFSNQGIGGMSRRLHSLYRNHLFRSSFVRQPRPVLLNSWEAVYFTFDEQKILQMARASADLGIKLFVMDDGWFGVKYPRVNSEAGLGDWKPNPRRFPNGLGPVVAKVNSLSVAGSTDKLQFGIWVEPEMVNPKSELFEKHPDWVLQASSYAMTEERNQVALNLSLTAVQDYIIDSMTALLRSAPITYVKWDNNRGLHESPSPKTYHAYMLGLYRVLEVLTSRFPNVLWEGCASGGGRFDPSMLQYFAQFWASDNTDAVDRIAIQFGTTLAYPASCMGCHVSAVPNDTTKRTTTLTFRAHVAMMGGSFGFELDPTKLSRSDRAQIPDLIKLVENVNPIVINGDMWKLSLPDESNHPAAMFISPDGKQAVLFAFQMVDTPVMCQPTIRLQGLDAESMYMDDGKTMYSGATLMNHGLVFAFDGDHDSRLVFLARC